MLKYIKKIGDKKIAKVLNFFIFFMIIGCLSALFFDTQNILAGTVTNLSDTISDSRINTYSDHAIAFRTINPIDASDSVIIKFDDSQKRFSLSQLAPLDIADYDFSVDGIDQDIVSVCIDNNDITVNIDTTQDYITFSTCPTNNIAGGSDIRIEIGANAAYGGNGINQIQNPPLGSIYFIDIAGTFGDTGRTVVTTTPSSGMSISATVGEEIPEIPPGSGGGAVMNTGNLKMIGKAYPEALITILKEGKVIGTDETDKNGDFNITIKSIPSNKIYEFGIYAQDKLGLSSPTLNFILSINTNQVTEVSNVYIPPTIAITSNTLYQGDKLEIYGSSYAGDIVVNFISPSFNATSLNSDEGGRWSYFLDTTGYEPGEYFTASKSVFLDGEQTENSEELKFKIIKKETPTMIPTSIPPSGGGDNQRKCNGADLNNDSKIDIIDFSIMMYYWQSKKPNNPCSDINQDGIVNIYDFSIMMYFWNE